MYTQVCKGNNTVGNTLKNGATFSEEIVTLPIVAAQVSIRYLYEAAFRKQWSVEYLCIRLCNRNSPQTEIKAHFPLNKSGFDDQLGQGTRPRKANLAKAAYSCMSR